MDHTVREEIIEVVNKLFIYTDEMDWFGLKNEVFTEQVIFDMSSLGQEVVTKTAQQICDDWKTGFAELDAVNHLAGNHLVTAMGDEATVFVYATATHYKEAATQGKTREFVGTYNLVLERGANGWRINSFKYNLKYMNGNIEMT